MRIIPDVQVILQEVVQHLTSLTGSEVEIHLEVRAKRREGFDENTVSENSRTLKFDTFEFEP